MQPVAGHVACRGQGCQNRLLSCKILHADTFCLFC